MPIYMRITQNGLPVITGDVTAKGHEKWIALESFQWGPTWAVYTPGGTGGQAEARKPAVREIVITRAFSARLESRRIPKGLSMSESAA
jgi:type VI protein secretion system component Hcp